MKGEYKKVSSVSKRSKTIIVRIIMFIILAGFISTCIYFDKKNNNENVKKHIKL